MDHIKLDLSVAICGHCFPLTLLISVRTPSVTLGGAPSVVNTRRSFRHPQPRGRTGRVGLVPKALVQFISENRFMLLAHVDFLLLPTQQKRNTAVSCMHVFVCFRKITFERNQLRHVL